MLFTLIPFKIKLKFSLNKINLEYGFIVELQYHGTIIRTGITCKKIPL